MAELNQSDGSGIERRSFIRTAAGLGVAAAFGIPATGSTTATEGTAVSAEFLNPRVQEARHAWKRGYRGRTDRSLGLTDTGTDTRHPDLGPWSGATATTEGDELEVDGNPFANTGGNVTPSTSKTIAWHNDDDRFGVYSKPRDANGHGTHVASIMAGTGRASAIDPDRYEEDDPFAVLTLGDTLSYEIEAEAGTGVFGSAEGHLIELAIEGPDGEELATSVDVVGTQLEGNIIVETPTVHDEGEAAYTMYVRPQEGELLSTGTADRIAVGAFKNNQHTVGDRTSDGDLSLHAGIAPNASIVSLSGLSTPTLELGEHADAFAAEFNMRALNMSWGYLGGLPLGAAGGRLDEVPDAVTSMAEAGILPVAAAGNDATPASGNGAPAVVNEAISVVSTGAWDGIAAYSSGGIGGIDENDEPYMKPDVTAHGGTINVTDIAAENGDPEDDVTEQEPDEEAAEAELEPVVEWDDLEEDDLDPETSVEGVTNNLPYDVELDDEVIDELLDAEYDLGLDSPFRGATREGDGRDGVRDYRGAAGTSMAAPSVAGIAGLVGDAMEFDAPDAIALEDPNNADRDDVLRLKATILATASETALTATPYHRAKAPVYRFGGRDPYEGYGRANVGPAIDAVTRELTDGSVHGEIGLDIPRDERAEAGYVRINEPGEITAAVEFSHYSGGNASATKGDPHVDLFMYDAQNPDDQAGDPVIVARDAGIEGDAEASTSVSVTDLDANGGERVFYVVAKLVNVPGLVTGFDAQVHFDLETTFDPEGFVATGSREGDASIYTAGNAARDELDVEVLFPEGEEVIVRDYVPENWEVEEEFGDVEATTPALGGGTYVYFGVDEPQDSYEELNMFTETPEDVEDSDTYTLGPIAVTRDTEDTDERTLTDREYTSISGTERNVVVVAEDT